MPRKHPIRTCACGKPVSAGRTQTGPWHYRCLVCETAAVTASFVYPPRWSAAAKNQTARPS